MTIRFPMMRAAALIAIAALLSACSGGGGGGESANPPPPSSGGPNTNFVYSGPAPRDADVQRFQQNFYNNLVNDDRCGSCHTRGGTGSGAFVDRGDVNVAYDEALRIVNFENPAASPVVAKVTGGHNCWTTAAACRVLLTSYIENWAAAAAGGAVSVKFNSPTDRDPNGAGGGFRAFPAARTGVAYDDLHALLQAHCAGCHRADAPTAQQPYFAAPDPDVFYAAVQPKIDLNTPARSRLYLRLRDEHHNCWSSSCDNDAQAVLNAINTFAASIAPRLLDADAHRSAGQVLNDGIIGSSGGRFEQYQIALWQFKEGSGDRVSDTSGVAPGIELAMSGSGGEGLDYQWVSGWGMQFYGRNGTASAAAGASRKLYDMIAPGGEYTVEAWVAPANVSQENAQIFAYGDGTSRHNSMLGQSRYNYEFFNRTGNTNINGAPALATRTADERAKASLQHVVATYSPTAGRRLYVDGEFTGDADPVTPATFAADWSTDYGVFLGGTRSAQGKWAGVVKMLSVHNRALGAAQVQQNFDKGVGEKRYLMFNISHVPGVPAGCANGSASYCYIVFEVSQFDNYAYLFNRPLFISLDPNFVPYGMTIKGIRIGINGQLAAAGQAYIAVNTTVNSGEYRAGNGPESGQLLYDRGTIIGRENGPDVDLFYIELDQVGSAADRSALFMPPIPAFAYALDGAGDEINAGWKLFDSISYSFAQLTGVAPAKNDAGSARLLDKVFASTRQSLPVAADYQSFLASHQTAIAQLAIGYCAELMNDATARTSFFGGTGTPNGFRSDLQNNLVTPLVSRFISDGPAAQPTQTAVINELMAAANNSAGGRNAGVATSCGAGGIADCDDARTLRVATVLCAGALGSAAITSQ